MGAPYQFLGAPAPYGRFRTLGWVKNFGIYKDSSGLQRMLSLDNYGYLIFNLSSPGAPGFMSQLDIELTIPRVGDTFSTMSGLVTAPDGSRALVATGTTVANGVLLMKPAGSAFTYGGDFRPTQAVALALDQVGGRWWGYALKPGAFYVADVTNFFNGSPPYKPGSIVAANYDLGSYPRSASVANHLIVFATAGGIGVMDARNPSSGAPTVSTFSAATLGFPSGVSIERASAALHPNGTVYVVVEGVVNGSQTAGFVLGTLSPDGTSFVQKGTRWMPPAPYSGSGSEASAARPAMVPDAVSGDIRIFVWGSAATAGHKLFGLSAKEWEAGTPSDLTPTNSTFPVSETWAKVTTTEPLVAEGAIYLYVGVSNSGQALRLSCTSQNSAPTATISATTASGASIPDGGTAFVGDSVRLTASIAPAPSSQAADWAFDLSFHDEEWSGSVFPMLRNPDRSQNGASSQPFTNDPFVGPCEPHLHPEVNVATGAACWNSVKSEFGSTAEGAVHPFRFAMEARNSVGSSSLRTFTINWKIPKAQFTPVAVLNGGQVSDSSEGSPRADGVGFRWWFGETPGGDAVEDIGCKDSRTCRHSFNNGKGKYKAWIQAAYPNGFVSADKPTSVSSLREIEVQDVVLTATGAPPSVTRGAGPVNLPIRLTKTFGTITDCQVSGSAYAYSVCNVSDSACGSSATASYSPLPVDGSGNAPIAYTFPSNGNYYLRIKYFYSTGGGCASPLSESWKPAGETDPTAFKITATDVVTVPSIFLMQVNGGSESPLCQFDVSCLTKFTASVGQTLKAYAYVNGESDPNPPAGLSWSFGSTGSPSPPSGNGQGVQFSYNAASTNVTVTMTGYGQTYTYNGKVTGSAPVPLSLNVNASPNPQQMGQAVQFSASASGGTPTYSWSWVFGDGGTSTSQNPTHTYVTAGNYSASCTVSDSAGGQKSVSKSVTITQPTAPTLEFALTDTQSGGGLFALGGKFQAASGQNITFTARLGESLAPGVIWVFGDGQQSAANPAQYTYTNTTASDRTYAASVSNGGTPTAFQIVVTRAVNQNPTGAYTYRYTDGTSVSLTAVDASKPIKFTAADDTDTYDWDFGDGSGHGTTKVVDHQFPGTGGSYTVSLSETKGGGTYTTATPVKFTVPAPPEPPRWMLVGMVAAEGQGGARWRSDVTFTNPSPDQGMALKVWFVDAARAATPPEGNAYVIPLSPLGSRTISDVLGDGFRPEWGEKRTNPAGALLIQGDSLPPNTEPIVLGKTYNTGTVESGTFGLSIPGVRVTEGLKPQSAASATQLIGLRQSGNYYTNLAVVNLRPDDADVEVRFYDALGRALGTPVSYQVGPYGVQQRNNVLRDAAGVLEATDLFRAVLTVKKGAGVTAYASVTDDRTKDPIFIAPQPRTSPSYRLPGVVRVAGANNALFRSDVILYNSSPSATRAISLDFTYRRNGGPTTTIHPDPIALAPGQLVAIPDFVKDKLVLSDTDTDSYTDSFVDIKQGDLLADPVLVMGRTYNQTDNGTIGLQVKAFAPADSATQTGSTKRLALTGLRSGKDYRANVAFFVGSDVSATPTAVRVKLVDRNGNVQRTFQSDDGVLPLLNPSSRPFYQIADQVLFGGATWDTSDVTAVIEVVSGSAPISAYATVLDNKSNDSVFIPAAPLP